VIDLSPRAVVVRALLVLTLAYVLILQGLFGSAAASSQLANASALPGMMQALCSGAPIPDEAVPDDIGHHGAAQSSCCAWGAALALDPIVPPTAPAVPFPYLASTGRLVAFGQVMEVAILFRVATRQGSRAPPDLAA
jgi:hypothetical protein